MLDDDTVETRERGSVQEPVDEAAIDGFAAAGNDNPERLHLRTTLDVEDPRGSEGCEYRAKEACPIPCWCCEEYEDTIDTCCWPLEPRHFEHICADCLREIRGFSDSVEEKELLLASVTGGCAPLRGSLSCRSSACRFNRR